VNPGQPHPEPASEPLRIGFISARSLDNANHLSGMPHRMAKALAEQGLQILPIITNEPLGPTPLHRRITNRFQSNIRSLCPTSLRKWLDNQRPAKTKRRVINDVTQRSQRVEHELELLQQHGTTPDAIFGCCISSALYALETKLPIIYFSDATHPMVRDTYRGSVNRGKSYHTLRLETEQGSVERATRAIFASPIAQNSAINDLGIDPSRTKVVPMGAHVTPNTPSTISAPTDPPTRGQCNLLIVAANPIRKRVDLAVAATQILRDRGINATLHVVGPGTPKSRSSTVVQSHGRLRLDDPSDRTTHQHLLRDCHIQLLPSLGEAFGIAPIESAHFARPSIVADAGGLPFVVLHNQTGLVLDRDADAAAWANAIESLINTPDHYRTLSTAALQRAQAELNWEAWGRSVAQIIRQTVADQG
jgi:glycosyltransferase involved in cell wall biosynthesis